MAVIKIPRDVSKIKEAVAAAFKKQPAPIKDPAAKARADKEAAARVKSRELAKELESTKLTAEEKDGIIAELKEQLATATSERDKFKPLAEQMEKFDHIERSKLIEKLPPEEQKGAKALPLMQLRTFVKAFTGAGSSTPATQTAKTEEELLKLADTNPTAFLEALDKKQVEKK